MSNTELSKKDAAKYKKLSNRILNKIISMSIQDTYFITEDLTEAEIESFYKLDKNILFINVFENLMTLKRVKEVQAICSAVIKSIDDIKLF